MESNKFRPAVEGLEDRHTPSVSFTDVAAALAHASQATDEVAGMVENAGKPHTAAEISFIGSHFHDVAAASQNAATVLSDYLGQMNAQAAADPAAAVQLAPAINYVTDALSHEQMNVAMANWVAVGYGGTPFVPPAPPPAPLPPVPPPPTSVTPPTSPPTTPTQPPPLPQGQIGATLSTTMPDVNDPHWQAQPNGLKIWDVASGSGKTVQAGDQITVNYTGWLASNGNKFDSSQDPGRTPFSATLDTSNLIAGWVQGVPGMQPGTIRRLYIPSALAYGAQGQGSIPPNSDLVFEIQLLSSP